MTDWKNGSTTPKNSSGLDENTTCPVSKTSSLDPGMQSCTVCLTSGGKRASLDPQTISVGTLICDPRLRKSWSGPGKLRHMAAATAEPDCVRALFCTACEIASSLGVCGTIYLGTIYGIRRRLMKGTPSMLQKYGI